MSRRFAITLPEKIEIREDIVRFFMFLDLVDRTSFHPDDRFWTPEGGVQYVNRAGNASYTVAEAKRRDRLMRQAWEVSNRESLDIYSIALIATCRDREVAEPEWIHKAMTEIRTSGRGSRKYWDPAQDA